MGRRAVLALAQIPDMGRNLAVSMRLALVAFIVCLAAACAQEAPADPSQLVVHTENGDVTFTVEIADTADSRSRGLMFRTELAPDAGMLFDFFEEGPRSFWMRNTFIPLDMIFIKADGTITNVHANAVPHDTTGIRSSEPVRFVFEIAGGRAAELGIKSGDTIAHPRVGS